MTVSVRSVFSWRRVVRDISCSYSKQHCTGELNSGCHTKQVLCLLMSADMLPEMIDSQWSVSNKSLEGDAAHTILQSCLEGQSFPTTFSFLCIFEDQHVRAVKLHWSVQPGNSKFMAVYIYIYMYIYKKKSVLIWLLENSEAVNLSE